MAICIHRDLAEETIVSHVITCHGRDHLVNIQSGRHNFVFVNVHFRTRTYFAAFTSQVASYSHALTFISQWVGIFFWVTGDPRKTAMFHSFSTRRWIAQSDYTRRDSSVLWIIRTMSRIFLNLPLAEARDFHCYSHDFENLGNRTIPSDHEAGLLVIQKPTTRRHLSKGIPSWMCKRPVFCSFCNG